jgi:ribonucleotide monophosphatase NagD (HAD superfamily)
MSDHEIGTSQMDSSVKVVIVGADTGFSYRKLCTASLYFDLNDSQFIATNRDRVFKTN